MSASLRDRIIRLAHVRADLRPHLLRVLGATGSRPRFPAFLPLIRWMSAEWPGGTFTPKLWDTGHTPAWNVMLDGEAIVVIRAMGTYWEASMMSGAYGHTLWKSEAPPTLKQLRDFIGPSVQRSTSLLRRLTSPVVGVVSSRVSYGTVEEWHDTSVDLVLELRKADPVPEAAVKEWLQDNWPKIRHTIKHDPPGSRRMAGWREDDEDGWDEDEEEEGYGPAYGRPDPNLGWMDPTKMDFREFEEVSVRQNGAQALVHMNVAIRD